MPEMSASPNPKAKAKPANAPIVVSIYKYTSEASDLVATFRPGEPLWAVRVEHTAWPTVESSVISATNAFLLSMHAENSEMPENLQVLRNREQIILQLGRVDDTNVDNLPLKEFSIIYYIGGTVVHLRNALNFLIDFFLHRCTHPLLCDRSPWPVPADLEVQVHPRLGIDLGNFGDDITGIRVRVETPKLVLPQSLWDTNPPGSNRALMVEIEILNENSAIFGWDGRTYVFRARFEQALVPRVQDNLRVLPEDRRDFNEKDNIDLVLAIFGNLVLRDLVCCVRVTGEDLPEEGVVADFIKTLKNNQNLFFDAF